MTRTVLHDLLDLGQQIWLDNLSRDLLEGGRLAQLLEIGVSGITTNPSIFENAIAKSPLYREDVDALRRAPLSPLQRLEQLTFADVRRACDLLLPLWQESGGERGYVSLEVDPELAPDAAGTIAAARRVHAAIERPNLLVKIPGTAAGAQALETLVAEGINVNVTLLFSRTQYRRVAEAYRRGLEQRQAAGRPLAAVFGVASLFLSRLDTAVDALLAERAPEHPEWQGKTAVAFAKLAYQDFRHHFDEASFGVLRRAGARVQRPLWASTSTKNPAYPDLLYVEPLVGQETVNTLPEATLTALLDHGQARGATILEEVDAAQAHWAQLARLDIDPEAIGEALQQQGLAQFEAAQRRLLALLA
jgi:transaldolase